MCRNSVIGAALLTLGLGVSPAIAQQGDWTYEGTIYLFAAETKTSIGTPAGTIDSTLSFSDVLSKLDFAFMGAFGASNGRWSILLDYMYTDQSYSTSTPGPVLSAIDTSLKLQILSAYGAYRVYDVPTAKLDLAAGVRWFDTQTTLSLEPSPPGLANSLDQSWTIPLVGLRAQFQLSEQWAATAVVDYGGFQGGEKTSQALLTADYSINDSWVLRGGYRYISVDHDSGDKDFSFSQSGPIFGAAYRF